MSGTNSYKTPWLYFPYRLTLSFNRNFSIGCSPPHKEPVDVRSLPRLRSLLHSIEILWIELLPSTSGVADAFYKDTDTAICLSQDDSDTDHQTSVQFHHQWEARRELATRDPGGPERDVSADHHFKDINSERRGDKFNTQRSTRDFEVLGVSPPYQKSTGVCWGISVSPCSWQWRVMFLRWSGYESLFLERNDKNTKNR